MSFKEKISNEILITGFTDKIIPGIFGTNIKEVVKLEGITIISNVFNKYVNDLIDKKLINKSQAQSLDLLWVEEIKKLKV